jgi:hypothetical protein
MQEIERPAALQTPHGRACEERDAFDNAQKQTESQVDSAGLSSVLDRKISPFERRLWRGSALRAHLYQTWQVERQRQRRVQQLHALGSRALYELVTEMVEDFGSSVDARVAEYVERLTPGLLASVGGDRFPESPIRSVAGGAP